MGDGRSRAYNLNAILTILGREIQIFFRSRAVNMFPKSKRLKRFWKLNSDSGSSSILDSNSSNSSVDFCFSDILDPKSKKFAFNKRKVWPSRRVDSQGRFRKTRERS